MNSAWVDDWEKRWIHSDHSSGYGRFKVSPGNFYADKIKSRGLQTPEDARYYAIVAPFDEEFDNLNKTMVIQFSVKFEQDIDCGGGYVKLLSSEIDPTDFHSHMPYNIMFGPDICGPSRMTHAIITYRGQDKDNKKGFRPPEDELTRKDFHVYIYDKNNVNNSEIDLYTFILYPNQTYEAFLDLELKISGSLLEDYDFLPPKEIKDGDVQMPPEYAVSATIPDPNAKKPDDWDKPQYIIDPEAVKPDDWYDKSIRFLIDELLIWNDTEDGEWEHPKILNPEYKGDWMPELIPNPAYKGEWVRPMKPNPDY
ncbi:hypothetical protein HK098_006711, partial [Nowakowskiella sp. JEL0407]